MLSQPVVLWGTREMTMKIKLEFHDDMIFGSRTETTQTQVSLVHFALFILTFLLKMSEHIDMLYRNHSAIDSAMQFGQFVRCTQRDIYKKR